VERFLDLFFSVLALMLLSPLLMPIALLLKLSGEGEVFFVQRRVGRSGRAFSLFKFATMLKNSPDIGTGTVTIKDDPRVLPVGKLLRKTKINELPQLWNVLIGDMSIVGPRPLTLQTFSSYATRTQSLVKQVRPGLSGIGSIIFRGEEEIMYGGAASVEFYDNTIAPYKGELEEWFVSHKSLGIYFKIIFVTLWVVLFQRSQLAWTIFHELPEPPRELKRVLNYPEVD